MGVTRGHCGRGPEREEKVAVGSSLTLIYPCDAKGNQSEHDSVDGQVT